MITILIYLLTSIVAFPSVMLFILEKHFPKKLDYEFSDVTCGMLTQSACISLIPVINLAGAATTIILIVVALFIAVDKKLPFLDRIDKFWNTKIWKKK